MKIRLSILTIIALFVFSGFYLTAQTKTKNIILVTIDGMRWQEVFGGADSVLLRDKRFTKDSSGTCSAFWDSNLEIRRKKLFPFMWSEIATKGQLHGNRWNGSRVNLSNPYQFSYPGYNEMLTGFPDLAVNSNDKIKNKNTNVLEFINRVPGYKGKIAVFSSWDDFPYIVNKWRNQIYVNSDKDTLLFNDANLRLINDIQNLTPRPVGVRPDVLTYMAGREYLKAYHPKVLYIAFDETDDLAHAGEYDQYLNSAHAEDGMLADLWKLVQADPQYRNKTTLIVCCDHGRGDLVKENWRHHGEKIKESGEIWFAVIGPDTKPTGESKQDEQIYLKQLASTISALLGMKFTAEHPVAEPIQQFLSR